MEILVKKLTESFGPSGYEDQIREVIIEEVKPYCDELRIDSLGNLIVRKGKINKENKTLMIAAHMDEIGVMVTQIDENGFIRFTNIGGIKPYCLIGSRVKFANGVIGVIGFEITTVLPNTFPTLDKLFIDVGVRNRKECLVKVGDVAAFNRPFIVLGDRIVSKALDDRIACYILVEGLKRIKHSPNTLYFVFTVQEEVGFGGAKTSAYGINPDYGLAVDVTVAADTPKAIQMETALGKGPAIKVRDENLMTKPALIKWMSDSAEKINIPYQYEVLAGGSTDAGVINLTRSGVPSICLSVPTRYIHSPSEMVDINDVENSVKLLVEMASNPIGIM